MVAQLEAVHINATEGQMNNLRKTCSNMVAENNGIVSFEEAYRYQHR